MNLVLFDLDDTLFDGDTEGEWVSYMLESGLIEDKDKFSKTMQGFETQYRNGELNVLSYSEFLLDPIKGKNLNKLQKKIDEFALHVSNKLSDKLTASLLKKHKSDLKVLTSGSLSFLVNKIATNLDINVSFGTDARLLNGIFTGEVEGVPNFSDEKVRRIRSWMNSRIFEVTYAYSDSIFDLPLLEFADIPTAVNPDKKLRKEAERNSWTIEDYRLS
tara:strand:+ start:3884 stop:4534 length:651 start_codon:yes stop_codon:yes gene_type:complete